MRRRLLSSRSQALALSALVLALSCAALGSAAAEPEAEPPVSLRFIPAHLPPATPGAEQSVAVIVRQHTAAAREVAVSVRPSPGMVVTPAARRVSVRPNADTPVFFRVSYLDEPSSESSLTVLVGRRRVGALKAGGCYPLETIRWRCKPDEGQAGAAKGWTAADFDDSEWGVRWLPSMWKDVGVTYLRASVFVPEFWRGHDVLLRLQAVDDHDVCYLNGVEIGRTEGWDLLREYRIAPNVIRYGTENLLCIAVNNTYAGGGIYRSPNYFGIDLPEEAEAPPSRLSPPRAVGEPLPFRGVRVEDGVLVYEDGGEVALWGANYYPQSWHQYENMKRLGVDMKQAIRDDLDDMKRMGVEVIRIHVFDREISDRTGNLLDNEHLELLDYLIAEASKRGIYFMFTPIAWWWGPDQDPDSFAARTPKEYMYCDDEAIRAQANYLRNWLNHVNRHTGKRYQDEPAICVLEIMNEPAYADYTMMTTGDAAYYRSDPKRLAPFRRRLSEKWRRWCVERGVDDDPLFFPLFRYQVMSEYLDTMYHAIRHTGARQPVACSLFDTTGQDDLIAAIADSRCEAVTTGLYAGTWDRIGDGVNYLPQAGNTSLDHRLDQKARLIYEFDGIKTFGSYVYPACARRFRSLGAQIACMFQYDSRTTAEWNTDWDAHYLNLLYTPGKAASFRIGGRVFRALKRGQTFPTDGDVQRFGNCAVSFTRDISIYADAASYLQSAPFGDWRPLPVPDQPQRIVGVGDSPLVRYGGSGIYDLKLDYAARKGELIVNPDATIVGDPWHPDPDRSAVTLSGDKHPFRLTVPGIALTRVIRREASETEEIAVKDNGFEVGPGRYELTWQ